MIASGAASALLGFDAAAFASWLVEGDRLAEHERRVAEEVARQNGQTFIRAALDLGLIGDPALAQALAEWMELPLWDPDSEDASLSGAAPARFLRASNVLALDAGESGVRLVVADPADRAALRALLARLPGEAAVEIGSHKDIRRRLEEEEERSADEADAGEGAERLDVSVELGQLRDLASEAPVIRFFNQTIERAMELGASDVHIERFDRRPSLRVRVDGMLIEQPAPAPAMYEPLLCRIKIMAGLDIAERRLAQDGRIRMRLRGRMVDLRVSLVPTMHGQDAAIRIQDRQKLGAIDLSEIGFEPEQVGWLDRTARKSHGILLITGPTGSGKTTTLYAILRRLASAERKIITVEDPVEYAMEGINQIQVNAAIGLTFSSTLRNILRHDPDVILVGEIRDAETAEMAFQAALTGHMVLSTLHTNDAPSAITRLVDMGVEPYLVSAAVEGVTAQRLLRKVCAECGNEPERREGCKACNGLGYRGRVAVMEQCGLPGPVKRAVSRGADEREVAELLGAHGYEPMRAHAERLESAGVTDFPEIERVLGAHAPDEPVE
jgi:general secretion pathway protein E